MDEATYWVFNDKTELLVNGHPYLAAVAEADALDMAGWGAGYIVFQAELTVEGLNG